MRIFVVEDDPFFGEALKYQLALNPDYEVLMFTNGKDCLSNLYTQPDAISLDYSLPDLNGKEVLKRIKKSYPEIPVVILSGQEDMETALDLLREGAEDYLIKNVDAIHRLRNVLKHISEKAALKKEVETLKDEIGKKYSFSNIIGNSQSIQEVFKQMYKAARSNITVSITGETGTGKELAAKSIHYHSNRARNPFVAVNVAAIPSELIESELFGHEKGAFTGAVDKRVGKFELANKGTLFLDEIGEMDLSMQSKLLRVLQERELVRIGGNQVIKVDFRLIIATHRNLLEEVEAGKFREDLFYRLLGLQIELPPLRERSEDIPILANHFLKSFAKQNKIANKQLTVEAKEKLMDYGFPGNIRELRAVVELAAVMSESGKIEASDITFQQGNVLGKMLQGSEDTLKGYTRKIVKHYMQKYNNNFDVVASKLDIGKSTIYKMKKDGEI